MNVAPLLANDALVVLHIGPPPSPGNLWSAWSFEPAVLVPLALTAGAYLRGLRSLWRRAGTDRGIRVWQACCFAGGLLAVFLALVTPLDALSAALFSAHMVQHLLLIVVAAPLLALGLPGTAFLWALPRAGRGNVGRWWKRRAVVRRTWRVPAAPPMAWALSIVALWFWHLPALYDTALRSALVHAVEHACFLATACLFWWALVEGINRGRLGLGAGILYVLATALQSTVLGAVLTFSSQAWYVPYASSTSAWGLSPVADQQLAGLIMWVPAGILYLLAAAIMFAVWIGGDEDGGLTPAVATPLHRT